LIAVFARPIRDYAACVPKVYLVGWICDPYSMGRGCRPDNKKRAGLARRVNARSRIAIAPADKTITDMPDLVCPQWTVRHRVGERRETGVDEAGGPAGGRRGARQHATGIAAGSRARRVAARAHPSIAGSGSGRGHFRSWGRAVVPSAFQQQPPLTPAAVRERRKSRRRSSHKSCVAIPWRSVSAGTSEITMSVPVTRYAKGPSINKVVNLSQRLLAIGKIV